MVKPGYKQTEIGVLPESWDTITFEDCFAILPNNTLSRAELNYNGGEVRNIHYGDILVKFPAVLDCSAEGLPYINKGNVAKASKGFLRDGDLIMADTAEDVIVGKSTEVIGIGDSKIVSGLHTIPCRPRDAEMFAPKWLGYFINHCTYHDQLIPYITGIKVSSVSKSAISSTVIAVPPKPEQAAIAEMLSDIDTLIVNLEKLIAKKKAIKQGAMQDLLTGKRRLPGFDGEWKAVRLGDHCTVLRGGSPRPIQAYLTSSPHGANWIKIGDVREGDKYITSTAERIIEAGIGRSREVFAGDFILSNSMSFGRPYILKINGCIHDGWLVIQNYQESFDQQYLYYVLGSDFVKAQYIAMAAGSSVQNLNKDKVSNVTLYKPDIEEQQSIAAILSDMDEEISEYEKQLSKYIGIKQGMMSELLTGRIRLV